jgi:hypothetical protein
MEELYFNSDLCSTEKRKTAIFRLHKKIIKPFIKDIEVNGYSEEGLILKGNYKGIDCFFITKKIDGVDPIKTYEFLKDREL